MTGLQWAVLTAYARTLPAGSEGRQLIDEATAKEKPTATGQRVAWLVAESAGMTHGQRITAKGKQAARAFLPLLSLRLTRRGT